MPAGNRVNLANQDLRLSTFDLRRAAAPILATLILAVAPTAVHAGQPLPPKLIYNRELPQESTYQPAAAGVTFAVTINDPSNTYAAYHDDVERVALAAAGTWATCLDGNGRLELEITFDTSSEDYIMRAGPSYSS